jgi:voltage-gated potassium channel
MAEAPRIQFPHDAPDAWRSLVRRVGASVGIIVVIAAITWLGRAGYRDVDGTPVSVLDAFYYATVTATTTGYGDIAPVDPTERAITAFVVTPLRILFLIVLVGTTLELLTERFRQTRAEARWRTRMSQHTIIVGYGTMGRGAVDTLLANGTARDAIVVVDRLPEAIATAGESGLTGIVADATRTATWRQARLDRARAVVVTCNRDDTATLVTLTARELNVAVPISVAVREAENAHLVSQSGATTVVLSSEAAGRLVGLSTQSPGAVGVLEDLLVAGAGLDLTERLVDTDEVGGPPRPERGDGLPIAVIRGNERISFDDPAFQQLQPGDVVVSLAGRAAPR